MSGLDQGVGAGNLAGIIGGIVTLLGAVSGGVAWLIRRGDTNAREARRTREEKLQNWQDELDAQERRIDEGRTAYTEKLEGRLGVLEKKDLARDMQLRALRLAFELVSSALRVIDPANTALRLADDMLRDAFPVSPSAPADLVRSLVAIEEVTRE